MKKFLSSAFGAYREYRSFKKQSKIYKIFNYAFISLVAAYFLTVAFPQYLFAHEVSHKNFKVYSRQPLDENIDKVLDSAEARLAKSPIYDESIARKVFLTDSYGLYTFLSNKAFRSFANSIPGIDNILINKSDAANDLVFMNRAEHNKRSLSGVIAHEVTHLFIKKKFGWARVVATIPTWKKEGYCEYVAGDDTLTYEEGIKYLKENPDKPSYFKYYLMVKYLIEKEGLSVEDLFNRDFDEKKLETEVFANL